VTSLDVVKRLGALLLGAVTLALWVLGTLWFKDLLTTEFNNAGYVAVPFGSAFVVIFLLPLISTTHRLWVGGSAKLRAAEAVRKQEEDARYAAAARRVN
jgi:hypothetical protein